MFEDYTNGYDPEVDGDYDYWYDTEGYYLEYVETATSEEISLAQSLAAKEGHVDWDALDTCIMKHAYVRNAKQQLETLRGEVTHGNLL